MHWTKLILCGGLAAGILAASGCRTTTPTAGGPGSANGGVVTLIANGASDYAIVVPDDDPGGRVGKAATLLHDTLKEATRAELAITPETKLAPGRRGIFLGNTRAAAAAGLKVAGLRGWTHRQAMRGGDLYLAGYDAPPESEELRGRDYLGTFKAVTAFLEQQVGVRFLLPGPNGIAVPKLGKLEVPAGLDVVRTPHLRYCVRWLDPTYDIANNQFSPTFYKTYGGHSYYAAVPKADYATAHPEYFALIGGVRESAQGHLCISNPAVQELMLKEMEKQLDKGYEMVQLAQTDGYVPCDCPSCRALAADPGERLWIVHRKLAEQMQRRRPGKKIVILSYGPTTNPPKTFDRLPANVVLELCNYQQEDFDQWRPFADDFLVYIYNWGTYQTLGFAPKRTPQFAGEQIRFFLKNKVRGIYKCGFGENLGLEGPVYYVYGKMIEDPEQDPILLANEYYRAAYGKARAPMKAFFDPLYERLELYSYVGRFQGSGGKPLTLMPRTPEDMISYFFPPKLLLAMEKNLERAKALTQEPREQARIRLVEREFTYLKNLASVFYFYHAYRLNPSWEQFEPLAQAIEARNALIDSWYDAKGKMRIEDGWPRFFDNESGDFVKLGGRLTGELSTPFNWNLTTLREKKVLPGLGRKVARVSRLKGAVTLDGKLNEPAWAALPSEELGEIGLGELREPTRFRLGWDDTSLYFAFECQWSNLPPFEPDVKGRDGSAWGQECLEIFLDPFGNRERYYHVIFNPIPNSCYDARYGFVDDPISPLYGKEDPTWNGDWQYAARIDREKKTWSAEVRIPFAALGVEAPKPGNTWCLNLGRENYVPNPATNFRGSPKFIELSLWSPNLEARSFGTPAAFGELVFGE
jgi:hypothetical protein